MREELTLDKYFIEQKNLAKDIEGGKLTYIEAVGRRNSLWDLVPSNILINAIGLDRLMEEKFGNDPSFNNYKITYIVNIN